MKITKTQLRKIIKEELSRVLKELNLEGDQAAELAKRDPFGAFGSALEHILRMIPANSPETAVAVEELVTTRLGAKGGVLWGMMGQMGMDKEAIQRVSREVKEQLYNGVLTYARTLEGPEFEWVHIQKDGKDFIYSPVRT